MQVGDELLAVHGGLVWVPLGVQERTVAEGPVVLRAVPLEYTVAALVALVLLAVWARRRLGSASAGVDPPDPD